MSSKSHWPGYKLLDWGTSLVVQWLGLWALSAKGPGFDPWSRNQIPRAATKIQHSQINIKK